jgi:hypothetical protein
VGLADKVWLQAVGREPGENSPWYRSHALAQRPKLATETLILQEWLNLALSDATAAAVQTLRAGEPIGKVRLGCDVGEGVGRSQSGLGIGWGHPLSGTKGLDGATHSLVPRKCEWPVQGNVDGPFRLVGVIAFRLQKRTKPLSKSGPRPEPSIMDTKEWPPVANI